MPRRQLFRHFTKRTDVFNTPRLLYANACFMPQTCIATLEFIELYKNTGSSTKYELPVFSSVLNTKRHLFLCFYYSL